MNTCTINSGGATIEIGECDLDSDREIAFDEAWVLLSDEERARAAKFVFEQDCRRFSRARGYLRRRLGSILHLCPADIPITTAAGGKPFVEGERINFSLSHSGSLAVFAFSVDFLVGIDLELRDRDDRLVRNLDTVVESCLTNDERSAFFSLPMDQRPWGFLEFWTAKEARMKLTGEGLALQPSAISLELENGKPVGFTQPLLPSAQLQSVSLATPGAVCCIAFCLSRKPGARNS